MSSLDGASLFYPLQVLQQFRGGDGCDGAAADPGKDVALQAADDLVRVLGTPILLLLGEPVSGDDLEAVRGGGLASGLDGLPLFAGVDLGRE
ncbi:hypothetical protein XAB3213_2530008 [Xanthomonas citri pv. bilvae]|nr:hypothetical protein XAB3213_2530008 [Xanthomonas citri pv. bilvae]